MGSIRRRSHPARAVLLIAAFSGCGASADASAIRRQAEGERSAGADVARGAQSVVVRRLWEGAGPDFWSASISPDGRYMSEIDWGNGDLAVLDLVEGALKHVTDKGTWAVSGEWAESSVFSPDGTELAYAWWNEDREGYEIRRVGLAGSHARTILPTPDSDFYALLASWSRDGSWILASLWDRSPTYRVAMVSADDGTVEPLLEFTEPIAPSHVTLSPDGRFLAFDRPLSRDSDERDLFVYDIRRRSEAALLRTPGADRLMGWSPDGAGILFASDRNLSEGLWWLPVANGAAAGEPTLVEAGVWHAEPLGFADDGRYFFGVTTQTPQVHTAGLDLAASRLTSELLPVEDRSRGRSRLAAWSPDGRLIAYVAPGPGIRPGSVVVRSMAGGGRQTIPFAGSIRRLWWVTGGAALLLDAKARDDDQWRIFRVDLRTAETTAIYSRDQGDLLACEPSPDGRRVFVATSLNGVRDNRIVERDLATGHDRDIATVDGTGRMIISPDGQTLLLTLWERESGSTRIVTLSIEDGTVREVHREDAPRGASAAGWAPSGGGVLWATWDADGQREGLWQMSLEGGTPSRIAGFPLSRDPGAVAIHPAGNRIAFTSGEIRGEVWVVEGLPGSEARPGRGEASTAPYARSP